MDDEIRILQERQPWGYDVGEYRRRFATAFGFGPRETTGMMMVRLL